MGGLAGVSLSYMTGEPSCCQSSNTGMINDFITSPEIFCPPFILKSEPDSPQVFFFRYSSASHAVSSSCPEGSIVCHIEAACCCHSTTSFYFQRFQRIRIAPSSGSESVRWRKFLIRRTTHSSAACDPVLRQLRHQYFENEAHTEFSLDSV